MERLLWSEIFCLESHFFGNMFLLGPIYFMKMSKLTGDFPKKTCFLQSYLNSTGGFSMGGSMAMHLAYRYHKDVAGVFALSSFLNKNSAVYQALKNETKLPELFQCHGTADELVLYSWGEETNKTLKSLGVTTTFLSFSNLYHELNKDELKKLQAWILKKLPDEPTD